MERLLRHNEEDLLFTGKNIHCRKKPLFKGLGDSLVYSGYFKKAKNSKEEIVVRKIKKTDCDEEWYDIFNKHIQEKDPIKHENVLKIISYEEMDQWRYFALERYDATLGQFCKGIYKGPMPSDAQVLCQITKGLLFLHKEQCTHGNLTPRTILIASSQPVRMMIKLSEFGLSKFVGQCDDSQAESNDQDGNSFHRAAMKFKYTEELGKQLDLCKKKYWILDGTTTESNQQTPTPNQDTFAAGCLCFYFLKRGAHPFGDDSSSILENIQKRNPVNLKTLQQEKGVWEFAYEPIENMIGDPPTDGKNWLMIAKDHFKKALPLRFEEKKENELGRGGFGIVYKGTYEGNAVAVKVTVKVHLDDARKKDQKREMEEHFLLDHENVLKLLHVDDSRDKTCLVLELCAGTLTDYCEKKYKGPELPPDGLVLYQIANGLHYIHSRNLVHRDVKPDNILISITTPVQMKLSDFGYVKKTSHRGTFTQSGLKGTEKWMAPEILELVIKMEESSDSTSEELPHGTIQSDTFAAGCVFFYFLTRGKHPFGNSYKIPGNIVDNNPIELNQHKQNLQGDDRALYKLIGKMIEPKDERIELPDVIIQMTNLTATRKFKRVARLVRERGRKCVSRFHPKKPVLACGIKNEIIFFSAENWSIPFSNWKRDENKFQIGHEKGITRMEWNADGSQLAIIFREHVIVWSYPSGAILYQKELEKGMDHIEWNPFMPNIFVTFPDDFGTKVFFFNSCPVNQRSFHFCTIECEKMIKSVQWISANRVALGLWKYGGIEIWEIDESTRSEKFVKRLKHESVTGWIADMAWDERTKCLAACSSNGWMTIWSMDSDQPIHAEKVDVVCMSFAWRPNGKPTDDEGMDADRKSADNFILATSGLRDGKIVIWTPLAKEKTRILSQHSDRIVSLSFSPDGRFLASEDGEKLIIWATENWEPVYIDEGDWGKPFSWLYSSSTDVPDYKLTFNSYDGKVVVVEYVVDGQ
ncbi:uncharacterized protein LOC124207482 isoform X1 [Daphnia pulex]|uniref:uncharacterized protein LOC124207482 isoform X1 n=1 Tax=Daphnia pulex TaxID=6669 RepID=UPI001EDF258B|nr:uncharacterized protein LOC124207482 isoform X1 [Daphnia pulex]